MRNNQPVTNLETVLIEHPLIVSKTDLKGQIAYINKGFVDIFGFSEADLIGQPHNIVHHPDLLVETFFNMWRDLGTGHPWAGLDMNRCNNGSQYWGVANATPIRENGQGNGLMSVRRQADAQQNAALVEEAAAKSLEEQARQLKVTVSAFQVEAALRSAPVVVVKSLSSESQQAGQVLRKAPAPPSALEDEWEEF